jgi:hypothetical protein
MADWLKQLDEAAEKKKKQMAAANAINNSTLMEQATGQQATASPKPTVVKPSVPTAVNTKPLFQGRTNDPVEVARNRALEQAQKERDAFTRLRSRTAEDMELYRTDPNERKKANLRYQSYSDKIAAADDVIRRATEGIGKDWETEKAAEIKAAGGDELLLRLVQLDELEAQKIKDAAARGDERRTGLTEDERTYNAMKQELRMLYGDKVDGWLEYVDRIRNKKQTESTLAKTAEKTKDSKFGMSAASVLTNKLAGAGYVDVIGQKLQRGATGSNAPVDYNSPAQLPSKVTNTIRGAVSEDMGGVGRFLYNTRMSIADSLTSMPMGTAGMVLLGGSAATNAMQEAAKRGATDNQALTMGLVAGVSEALLEKASVGKLFNMKQADTVKDVILNVLKQAGAEGTEEGLTNIANTIADAVVMGDKSEYETAKRAYMADGMSAEQAELKAFTDWVTGFALDVGGGMTSGVVMGGGKSGIDYLRNNRGGNQTTVDGIMPTIPQAEQPDRPAQTVVSAAPTVDNVMPKVQPEQTAKPDSTNATPNMEQIVRPDEQNQAEEDKMPAMGAADEGFNAYSHYQTTQDKFIPEGANAARPVDVPAVDPTGKNTRSYLSNAMGAQSLTEGTDAKLQEDFMSGKYGYEVKGDKAAVDAARAKLENSNYDTMRGATLERLESLKDLKQTVVDAQILAVEAMRNGRDADAAELFLMIATTETEFGQAVQATSILRKLSPEGQLEGVRRVAARLDAKTKKNRGGKGATEVSAEEQGEIMQTVDDVRETALRLLKNIHETFSERDHGIPVEDWTKEIGKKLASTISKSKQTRAAGAKTVSQTLVDDLKKFADAYISKSKPKSSYSHAQAVENFLNNPSKYAEAWAEAQKSLQEKYANNPSMLAALDEFVKSGIGLNQIGSGVTKDIQKAIHDIGAKTSEIIRSNKSDKAAVAQQVTDMLMKDHQLSEKDAGKMADFILKKFNEHVATQSEAALESMFKDRGKKPPKTVMQRFSELANMGAFTGSRYNQKATQKLFGEGLAVDPDLAQKFLDAPDEASREAVMEEIYKDLGEQLDTSFGEVARRWRYTAMLLNPATHIKNMAGNAGQLGMATVKDAIASVGEGAVDYVAKAIRKGKGIQRTKALLNPLSKADAKLLEQAGADYANVIDSIMENGKWKDTPEGKISKYKTDMKLNNPKNAVGRAVDATLRGIGKVSDFNEKAMNVEDSWFAKPRYQAALASYMKANGLTEITDEARAYAVQEAKKSTYRDSNAVSDFARSMGNSKNKNWVTKTIDFFVNAVFPFKGTPANVGVRAVEYSPAGLLTTIGKGAYHAIKGDFNAVSFIDDLSAGITGTALAAVGIWLAQLGVLRAKGAEDEKEKKQLEKEGYKNNSVNVFGYSVPISNLGATSVPLLVGAAIYENFVLNNPTEEGHTIDEFISALSSTLDPVLETTMLTGFQDAIQSFQQYDPEAEVGETFALAAVDIAGNYIASFIPTLFSRVANSTDESARQIYVDKNKDAQAIQRVLQTLQKKIPGLRNQMTEVVDAYGNTVEGGLPSDGSLLERVMAAIGNAVTPVYGSKIKTTAVDEEVRRLLNAEGVTGDYTLVTPNVPKSFEVGNKTVHLTADQYVQYQKTLGSSVQTIRGSVINSEAYNALPDDVKSAAMSKAYEYANALAKTGLDVGYQGEDEWMKELYGASPEVVAQTIIQRSVDNAALDKDLYTNKYDGLGEMLESNSINEQLALACMSETANTAYGQLCKPAGVSVQQFLDVYGIAYSNDRSNAENRAVALENIQGMNIPPEQKTALAQAAFSVFMDYIPKTPEVPDQWLLDNGDTDTIVAQMGAEQREGYDKYIAGSSVDMQSYLDFSNFASSDEAKTERDANGKEIKGKTRQDKIIDWLDDLNVTDEVKGRLFCTVYKRSSCPLKWRMDVPRD